MNTFPMEIASFPFYTTFHQILNAAVQANQAAQLSYLRNLQQIAFKSRDTAAGTIKEDTIFKMGDELNYVEFDSKLEKKVPNPNYATELTEWEALPANERGKKPEEYTTESVDKFVKVPLISVVDVRPMAIDKVTADLSISLKSEFSKETKNTFKLGQTVGVDANFGYINVKSNTELSYQRESSERTGKTREYNLEVHMEASTQPINAPLKNIIDYLIRAE